MSDRYSSLSLFAKNYNFSVSEINENGIALTKTENGSNYEYQILITFDADRKYKEYEIKTDGTLSPEQDQALIDQMTSTINTFLTRNSMYALFIIDITFCYQLIIYIGNSYQLSNLY